MSGLNRRRHSSMILPVVLKTDSEDTVETDTIKTSLANIESMG
jgi:hypothetical protein